MYMIVGFTIHLLVREAGGYRVMVVWSAKVLAVTIPVLVITVAVSVIWTWFVFVLNTPPEMLLSAHM
jgi:hypothetical protein